MKGWNLGQWRKWTSKYLPIIWLLKLDPIRCFSLAWRTRLVATMAVLEAICFWMLAARNQKCRECCCAHVLLVVFPQASGLPLREKDTGIDRPGLINQGIFYDGEDMSSHLFLHRWKNSWGMEEANFQKTNGQETVKQPHSLSITSSVFSFKKIKRRIAELSCMCRLAQRMDTNIRRSWDPKAMWYLHLQNKAMVWEFDCRLIFGLTCLKVEPVSMKGE